MYRIMHKSILLRVVFTLFRLNEIFSLLYRFDGEVGGFSGKVLADGFGFAAGGEFSAQIELSETKNPNTSDPLWYLNRPRIYVVLMNEAQRDGWFDRIYTDAIQNQDQLLCSSPAYSRFEALQTSNFRVIVQDTGMYTASVVICNFEGDTFEISVEASMLNPNGDGELNQHLPIQFVMLPYVYAVLLLIYLVLSVLWVIECYKMRAFMKKIHGMFSLSVFLKTLSTAIQYFYYSEYGVVGDVTQTFLLIHNFITYYSLASFLFTLLLVSLGWSITRRRLRRKEGKWLALVMIFYFLMASLLASCGDSEGRSVCRAYLLAEYIVRSMLMLFIIVAVNFNIHHVRLNLSDSPWNSSLASLYSKLVDYIAFRWVFIGYLLLPTFLLLIKLLILSWEYDWMESFLEEFFVLLIYVHTGVTFGPFNDWFLTRSFEGTLNEVQPIG